MTYHLVVAGLIGIILPLTRLLERPAIRISGEILTLGAVVALFAVVVVPDEMRSNPYSRLGGACGLGMVSGFFVMAGATMAASMLGAALWMFKRFGDSSPKKALRAAGSIAAISAIMTFFMLGPAMNCGLFLP